MKKCYLLIVVISIFYSCGHQPASTETTIASSDERLDQMDLLYAEHFSVDYYSDYKLLKIINPWPGSSKTLNYVLYKKEKPNLDHLEHLTYLKYPIKSVASTSSTHIAFLDFSDALDKIVGLSNLKFVYNQKVRNFIKNDKIKEIGGAEIDYEKIVAINPDLILTFVLGQSSSSHQKLKSLGIPNIVMAEYLEASPLGRLEWAKFVAALFDKEDAVQSRFNEVVEEYEALQKIKLQDYEPSVVVEKPWKGTWYMPNGKSYIAQFINDAGGNYLFGELEGEGNVALDFETVYARSNEAEVWLNVSTVTTFKQLISENPRYEDFKAVKDGRVYSFTNRVSPGGGHDIFESGVVHPHIILKDLIKIFHGDLFPEHELFYYKQLQ